MSRVERVVTAVGFVIAVIIVSVFVWSAFTKEVGATNYPHPPKQTICHNGETIEVSSVAALIHLRQHDGDYRGECKEEPKDYCDTLEGVQGEDEDCPPVEEPTCEELQNCPVEEPETPPVVVKKDRGNHDGCREPSKAQGFRFQFQGSGNLLKWEKKESWDKVDIAVYGMDKTTLLYYIRTADDGEHLMPTKYTWHRIRGVNKCGLGDWSRLIN